ncbi:hypothetical protein A2344_05310 [Candidatus Peregrinibacteria bacterium RIFOXYB12_FULL_41_12]|nr:MAG: hypothetical protein A2244_00485 [Candidatus Peregrinibacteria bacterium RIFOXYA2_FULL_41_18]OGJ48392.1 MAG: hypothetical protein A2344_05310 [Candidatus Peregrinibacteria bacterium RIFOXYB12_FULL_41_12]OGJ53724.1 MAG: hypothetical protein A2448_02095 [Candidatus Peregrinibacteria bacterium RIFOXYC2_FULL_41_22]
MLNDFLLYFPPLILVMVNEEAPLSNSDSAIDRVFAADAERYAISIMIGFGVDEHINSEDLTFYDLRGLDFVRNIDLQSRVAEIWNRISLEERRAIVKEIRKGLFTSGGEVAVAYAQALEMQPRDAFLFMFPDHDHRNALYHVISLSGGDHLKCDFWISHLRGVFAPYQIESMDLSFQSKWNAMPGALRRKIARWILRC